MMSSALRAAVLSFAVVSALFACAAQSTDTPAPASPIVEAPSSEAAPNAPAPPVASANPAASAPPVVEKPVVTAPPAASTAAPLPAKQRKRPPQNERDCRACNGDWGVHGLSPTPSCNCRTSDGGKRCRDGTECEGLCTAADDPEREVVERGPPSRGFFVGRCSKFASVFGCYRPIDDGASRTPVDLTEPPQMICAD